MSQNQSPSPESLDVPSSMSQLVQELVTENDVPENIDLRYGERFPYCRPVTITFDSNPHRKFNAVARDISESGIGLLHSLQLVPGDATIEILRPSGEGLIIPAKIEWCRRLGGTWYMSGCRFLSIAECGG